MAGQPAELRLRTSAPSAADKVPPSESMKTLINFLPTLIQLNLCVLACVLV